MKNKNVFLLIFQSMNDVWVSVKRVLKFVIPVTLGSIVFNIPKFFEAGVIYTNLSSNITVADLEVKSIRKDPNYIKYYNITARLLVNGIMPFLLLIYFNIMIYRDVKVNTYVFNIYVLIYFSKSKVWSKGNTYSTYIHVFSK